MIARQGGVASLSSNAMAGASPAIRSLIQSRAPSQRVRRRGSRSRLNSRDRSRKAAIREASHYRGQVSGDFETGANFDNDRGSPSHSGTPVVARRARRPPNCGPTASRRRTQAMTSSWRANDIRSGAATRVDSFKKRCGEYPAHAGKNSRKLSPALRRTSNARLRFGLSSLIGRAIPQADFLAAPAQGSAPVAEFASPLTSAEAQPDKDTPHGTA